MRTRRIAAIAAAALSMVLLASACEVVITNNVNQARTAATLPSLATAPDLTTAARAHSAAMCTTGVVAPSDDPARDYLAVEATSLTDLVASQILDPSIADANQRNSAATTAIWDQWRANPTIADPRWSSMGAGEHTCADGKLYMTLVLRDDVPAFAAPGDTSQIQRAETTTSNGWTYTRYRNLAYPCAISGYQSFVIGTKVGSSPTATRPLWVKMRGGGAGWFDTDGTPLPTSGVKTEEGLAMQLSYDTPGLMADVKAAPQGFRTLIVSLCSHDIYAGNDNYDPYNPNVTPDGRNRPTNGLAATKAAIQFTQSTHPTDDYFLHGTSAGGVGVYHVAWSLQQQGMPPAGFVSDSGVLNQAWQRYIAENGVPGGSAGCQKTTEERGYGVLGRIARTVGDPANEPDLLVSSRRLTVPVVHIWNHADSNQCGNAPIPCPLRDGTTPTMQSADCNHAPISTAIGALPASAKSKAMGVCVEGTDAAVPCDRHVVTATATLNTDPAQPADYQAAIYSWVIERLADD